MTKKQDLNLEIDNGYFCGLNSSKLLELDILTKEEVV